jgi:CheY-like chemotaxis protein
VLIVEEHDDTRAMYALALSGMGFEVVVAPDDSDGSRRAWELRPDIIVANLPALNGNGWPFLRELKQHPRTRLIPVVAVSGYVQTSVRERALRDGVAAFFAKPCLPDALAAALRRVLDASSHAHAEQ